MSMFSYLLKSMGILARFFFLVNELSFIVKCLSACYVFKVSGLRSPGRCYPADRFIHPFLAIPPH